MAIGMVFKSIGLNETPGERRAPRAKPGGSWMSRGGAEEEDPSESEKQPERREETQGGSWNLREEGFTKEGVAVCGECS